MRLNLFIIPFFLINSLYLLSDSFIYNNYNNHGSIGIINMPTARTYEEGSYGLVLYDGSPDQKLILTANPYDWLEASVFYTNIQGRPYPGFETYQDYKDKGFNFKVRVKKEGKLPSLAVGINDLAGTGLYGSEYIVSSYGIGKLDLHLGVGWGNYDGERKFRNPLSKVSGSFNNRPDYIKDEGGTIDAKRFFSGNTASPFYGFSYALNEKSILKIERDTTLTPGFMEYEEPKSNYSIGIDFNIRENFMIGTSFERGNFFSIRFAYKGNNNQNKVHKYKNEKIYNSDNKYTNFRGYLKDNGIGVNKIIEKDNKLGVEITQFSHNLEVVEEIIMRARQDSKINSTVLVNKRIVDLEAVQNFNSDFEKGSSLIYSRQTKRKLSYNNSLKIRPFIAGREGFLKLAALLENDIEYVLKDNIIFSSNLKYSLWDNFDDLIIPPVDTFPSQVRSDVKDYLRNFNDGIIVGRAQVDLYKTISKNNHFMFTAGILEEMFSGYGFEYLWFNPNKSFAVGFELFDVIKRDYDLNFGHLDYKNITGHINLHYRNSSMIPFDTKFSYGEYLAGDIGSTIELSRTFQSGIKFGLFASNTNVSKEDFGEGSFDKGIFFEIPIFGNMVNYSWRPLTKDPGQKLIRKNSLHDLLIRFKGIN